MKLNKEIVIASIPVIGTVLIFLGITKLFFFYSTFGISITSFIEFTDILVLFFDFIIIHLSIFSYVLFFAGILAFFSNRINHNTNKFSRWVNSIQDEFILIIIPILLFLLVEFLLPIDINIIDSSIILLFRLVKYAMLFLASIILLFLIRSMIKNEIDFSSFYHLIILLVNLFLVTAIDGKIDAFKIITDINKREVSFFHKERLIESDLNFYYIGNTKNYLFFHHTDGTNFIYPMNDIGDLKMK